MDLMLIRSRYKITQVLHVGTDYAAFLAVDIESREKTECLLNVYEGALGRQYASLFGRLQHCPEYESMFLSNGALVTVFAYRQAVDIDSVFYKGANVTWQMRLQYAQLLFHLALSVSDFPSEIACAAFLTKNLKILRTDMKLAVNYIIPPIPGTNSRELIYMLTDQIRKVLIRRFEQSHAERAFLNELESGVFTSVAPLYSHWQTVLREITAEYERVYALSAVLRTWHFITGYFSKFRKKQKRRK